MAATDKSTELVENKICKRCGNFARSGYQCAKCRYLIHNGCLKYMKNWQKLDAKTVMCCGSEESSDMTFTPGDEFVDDEHSDSSFCSIEEILEADVSNNRKDVIVLEQLIKHKGYYNKKPG
nr:unnamed protein product [Callosobruchus analis]